MAKLIPALINGIVLDSLLELFKIRPAIHVTLAAVVGGCGRAAYGFLFTFR